VKRSVLYTLVMIPDLGRGSGHEKRLRGRYEVSVGPFTGDGSLWWYVRGGVGGLKGYWKIN